MCPGPVGPQGILDRDETISVLEVEIPQRITFRLRVDHVDDLPDRLIKLVVVIDDAHVKPLGIIYLIDGL